MDLSLIHIFRDCYVLYSKESGNEYNVKFLDDYYPEFDEKFNRQIAYMNYQVQDANGEVIDGYRSNRDSWEKVKDTELADYALGIKISFDKNGEIKIDQVMGTEVTKQEAVLKILTSNLPEKIFEYESEIENISPKDRTYYFMMTEAKLNAYVMRVYPITSMVGNAAVYTILTLILLSLIHIWNYAGSGFSDDAWRIWKWGRTEKLAWNQIWRSAGDDRLYFRCQYRDTCLLYTSRCV